MKCFRTKQQALQQQKKHLDISISVLNQQLQYVKSEEEDYEFK